MTLRQSKELRNLVPNETTEADWRPAAGLAIQRGGAPGCPILSRAGSGYHDRVTELRPGTQVKARGLRREIVFSQSTGKHRLYRLRSLERGLGIDVLDLLSFEKVEPLATELDLRRATRLLEWRVGTPPSSWIWPSGSVVLTARVLARGAGLVKTLRGGAG